MNDSAFIDQWQDIDLDTYQWSVKIFRSLKKLLRVHMKLHTEGQEEQGDIFLFNHFSRFETFIPQYLIYEKSGAYSCAIASREFFKENTLLAKYLASVGVLPHDHARLFPLLAEQILRGRKVVIFPEGGMVKDRRVLDKHGHYSIFSRISGERRKHHTGAAVLAQGVEVFKASVRKAFNDKNIDQLAQWQQQLGFETIDQLLKAVLEPTLIIPANITFYPIRSSENILHKVVELFANDLTLRQTEELLIEGNIMLKNTDMDVRLGIPIEAFNFRPRLNRYMLDCTASEFKSLDEIFTLQSSPKNCRQRLLGIYFKINAKATRNEYMEKIYANVTINLSHLASTLIMYCIGKGLLQIDKCRFYSTLYIAIKLLQKNSSINLHRSLLNPEQYDDLMICENKRFEQFICLSKNSGLIDVSEQSIHFLPKLCEEHDFDTIRMENLIAVYENEAEPVKAVLSTVIKAYRQTAKNYQPLLVDWFLDDQSRLLQWSRKMYSQPRFDDVNALETVTENAEPFLFRPTKSNGRGILLIHGLLASPAEMIGFGKHVCELGFTVLGVRIKGHGTSPYELKQCSWEDWYASIEKQFQILTMLCERSFVCGFSTGGALALKLAEQQREKIIGVIAVTVPLKLVDSALMLEPLTKRLVRWVASFEGVKPFIEHSPEHPAINYRHIPVRSLYELRMLSREIEKILPDIDVATLFIFADHDPIVSMESEDLILRKTAELKNMEIKVVHADRHGILAENLGGTWELINLFLNKNLPSSDKEA